MAGARWVTALRAARLRRGLTQEELAARAGLSVRTVRGVEHGAVRAPRGDTLRRLAEAVGLPEEGELDGDELHLGVLGPLVLRRGEAAATSAATMPRLLLGLLALRAGRLVSQAEIAHALWGARPPESRQSLVHTYLSRLRKELPAAHRDCLVTVQGGYLLQPGPGQLDLLEFTDGRARAEALLDSDPEAALEEFERALGWWRGPVLADLPDRLREHPEAVALNQARVATSLRHGTLAVRLGRHDLAVRVLRPLSVAHPLHEDVHATLLLALAGAGRQAAALEVFAGIRDRLAEELGVEPGPALRDAHMRVLRGDVPAAHRELVLPDGPRPAQLPPAIGGFTGRAEELAALAEQPGSVLVTGPAGVGKTALAVHFAHRIAPGYPDGQLYLDLRHLSPAQALDRLLRGLGVPATRVPVELGEASALYRQLLAGRRVLVLLDNALHQEQLTPLLPVGTGSRVLVTARTSLDGLPSVVLDVLDDSTATALLSVTVGADRVEAEPEAAARLAELCAGLPLALRVTAAHLAAHPSWPLAQVVDELRQGDRLSALELSEDGLGGVRSAFDSAYHDQDPATRAAFRLLGVAPLAEVTAPALAALAGCDPAEAKAVLHRLSRAHLVRPSAPGQHSAPGRFTMHDLLRDYAAERAAAELPEPVRARARAGLHDWYVRTAHAATHVLYGQIRALPLEAPPERLFGDHRVAADWLDAEIGNLLLILRDAAEVGPRATSWRLLSVLRNYFQLRPGPYDFPAATIALAAAETEGDLVGQTVAQLVLADAFARRGDLAESDRRYRLALDRHTESGLRVGAAAIHTDISSITVRRDTVTSIRASEERILDQHLAERHDQLATLTTRHKLVFACLNAGDTEAAREHHRAARTLAAVAPRNSWVLFMLGAQHRAFGDSRRAATTLTRALEIARELRAHWTERQVCTALAELRADTGELAEATELARLALELARRHNDISAECASLLVLGRVHTKLGQGEEAVHCLRWARYRYLRQGDRHGELATTLALAQAWAGRDTRPARVCALRARDLATELHHVRGQRQAEELLARL
ncbi:DNA-binding SARP family transcriptional activator/tetratricopeptide (TPR) repeat protein/DNA-binding XRE family transcriptional regulator [Crossiella equi]|uniref:DNA-binding SARP family transcriptional activator/tetratricopeptide (TPR) repeat protein/DNA-binding XRE family transcriptional regulator n=1 Tax=Crossiella equi TaxID=130796 RepID=A0ABS5A766_9PSEU|nr:BTAD domain-containing putative transcriptional regulator [Crossiella equi]MBP2471535.1 DNA-binding SARP family transcriptional activator/tetratricopeptide (TPR) repeat protein/DNA-binding XRE family transcriptional regulator [Crossiella equi]